MPKLAARLPTSWLYNVSDVPLTEVELMLIPHLLHSWPSASV